MYKTSYRCSTLASNPMLMDTRVAAVLLWVATSVYSQKPPQLCINITRENTLRMQKQRCHLAVEEGYLYAFCNILVERPYETYARHEVLENGRLPLDRGEKYLIDGNVLTIKLQLVSDRPVVNMTSKDGPVCLSLQRIWTKKWYDFKGNTDDDVIVWADEESLGPFDVDTILTYIHQMSFSTIFHRPPQVAAAICKTTKPDGSCTFDIYGFLQSSYNSTFQQGVKEFGRQFNVEFSSTEALNVTLAGTPGTVPAEFLLLSSVAPVRHILFYKCNYKRISFNGILAMKGVEHLAFVQAPIEYVSPFAFKLIPHVKHISLVGTRLSGIPKAIFGLRHLDTFDMSNTNAFTDRHFDYCSAQRSQNSTVTRLILTGSKLSTLPSRAFCAFPMLEELGLDNCHLLDIPGSPFECLEYLKVLSISGNHIRSLYGKNVKGLKSLVSLDVSNNDIAYFQGSYILPTLISLRTLTLAHNELRKLELYSQGKIKLEELNLEGNQVQLWEPPLFTQMPELKKLSFANNEITEIFNKMLHDVHHVDNLDISRNPWNCFSCELNNLHTLLEKHPVNCSDCSLCGQPLEQYGVDVRNVAWREDDCAPPDYYRVYGVPALLSFMIASLFVSFVYHKRWYFMYALLYLKVSIKGYRRQRHAGRFLWDSFLSYHASDADWVRDVLLPRLESPPMQFRLCVAERDFIPGMEITENICRAIAQSRRSLFVLSHEFCRSRWCMFELSLAQHRLFESDRQDGMVFIKKNDVDESEMTSMLQYLTKSRTYVQLPPEGSRDAFNNLFWLQLQAALEQ